MYVVFVTTELPPYLPGGAGSVVTRLRDRLVDRGDAVRVILVGEVDEEPPPWVEAVDPASTFHERSEIAAAALERLCREDRPDLVEFQDFDGLAFVSLTRRDELGLSNVPIQVRFHGPGDLMFEAIGTEPPDIAVARTMETESYRMADRVVAPSRAIAALIGERYGIQPDRIVIGQPPLDPPSPGHPLEPTVHPTIAAVARLGEVKGSHDLVRAAVPILREHEHARLVLIGEDGWSATTNRPMSQWLVNDLIPSDVADRIEIVGRLDGPRLREELSRAWFIVIASRFESFNLVAHEVRALGLPIIVPDLPAFEGILDAATGAEVYDGSINGLTVAIDRLVTDQALRSDLAAAPLPRYRDPLEPYRTQPVLRHPRSQAGLATMAVQRLERSQPPPPPEWTPESERRSLHRRAATGILAKLPNPIARRIVGAIPARSRDRLAFVADWRYETQRARNEARLTAVRARVEREERDLDAAIERGDFPDRDDPIVSVVIPCHNDGRFLDDAIRSVLRQTMGSFEIIVVDDGSTDTETLEILQRHQWPRTRIIHQDNGGLSSARNTGMAAARGRYLVPLDADDMIEPNFMSVLSQALESNDHAGFAACRARLFGDVNAIWVPRPYNPYQLLLSNSIVGCVLMRRSAYEDAGRYDETMRNGNEDWDLWIRMTEKRWEVVEVPDVLFRYRKHGISMSVETEARFELGRAEIVERHEALYEEASLRDLKARFSPLVSVIVESPHDVDALIGQDIDDAQIVFVGEPDVSFLSRTAERGWQRAVVGDLADAAATCTGKFVIRWKDVTGVTDSTITLLADHLEGASDLGSMTTTDESPLVLIRRWSLLDPDGPSDVGTCSCSGSGSAALTTGEFPDPLWTVPAATEGLPVHRQRPEEEGRIPPWLIA